MLKIKRCSKCKIVKQSQEFHKCLSNSHGLQSRCIKCKQLYARTEINLIRGIYRTQKSSCKKRCMALPTYSLEELTIWILQQKNFKSLYKNWVKNNFSKELVPSIDRINDYESYTLNNIHLTTWALNKKSGYLDRRSGKNNKQSKAINQYSRQKEFIATYPSIRFAARTLNIPNTNIVAVCKGQPKIDSKGRKYTPKSAGGFIWTYV